jgi:Domain of unknown function (DUF4296)
MKTACLFFLLILCSCNESKKVPKEFLQPVQMQNILMDLLITDAVNSLSTGNMDSSFKLPDQNKAAAEMVFRSYKITRDHFEKSYAFYLSRPDLLKPIADSMAAVANRRSLEVTTPSVTDKPAVPDSIKKRFLHGNNSKDSAGQVRNR